jgi:hypothetical protein
MLGPRHIEVLIDELLVQVEQAATSLSISRVLHAPYAYLGSETPTGSAIVSAVPFFTHASVSYCTASVPRAGWSPGTTHARHRVHRDARAPVRARDGRRPEPARLLRRIEMELDGAAQAARARRAREHA